MLYLKIVQTKVSCVTTVLTRKDLIASQTRDFALPCPSTKNGIRLYIGSRPLKTALKRSEYHIPTVDHLLTELSNAKEFTLADIKSAFWHVPLDKPSSLLTTFNTPVGRMKWNRMPFGISVAPEEFQRKIDESLEGPEDIKAIADDTLIWRDHYTIEKATSNHVVNRSI